MKWITVTHVDNITGIPVTEAPAANGPRIPEPKGWVLRFWNEGEWPTYEPKFYGTVDDDYEAIPGVLFELTDEQLDEAKARELDRFTAMRRQQRNGRLWETDWTQLADSPVDSVAWAVYRQALRDVPEQEGFPFDIKWPEEPK